MVEIKRNRLKLELLWRLRVRTSVPGKYVFRLRKGEKINANRFSGIITNGKNALRTKKTN